VLVRAVDHERPVCQTGSAAGAAPGTQSVPAGRTQAHHCHLDGQGNKAIGLKLKHTGSAANRGERSSIVSAVKQLVTHLAPISGPRQCYCGL